MDVVLGLSKVLIQTLFCVGSGFLPGEDSFLTELGRSLERRQGVVRPESLQIRVTVDRSRDRSASCAIGARLRGLPRHQRNRQAEDHKSYQRTQGSMVHCRLLG
jgi:hypothetical protein